LRRVSLYLEGDELSLAGLSIEERSYSGGVAFDALNVGGRVDEDAVLCEGGLGEVACHIILSLLGQRSTRSCNLLQSITFPPLRLKLYPPTITGKHIEPFTSFTVSLTVAEVRRPINRKETAG
jgi:hypothetical protein